MNLDWIIGFLEGEGSLVPSTSTRHTPQFIIYQKDKKILDRVSSFLGMGRVVRNRQGWALVVAKIEDQVKLLRLLENRLETERKRIQFKGWKDDVLRRWNNNWHWKPREDETGVRLLKQGHSFRYVAGVLARDKGSVINRNRKAWKLNLRDPNQTL